MVTDVTSSSGEQGRNVKFGRCRVAAVLVEISLGVYGFYMDRGTELTIVDANIDVQKGDIGEGTVPGEVDSIAIVELFQEGSEGVGPTGPE